MKRFFQAILLSSVAVVACCQDIIVRNDGASIKAYNLDMSSQWVYYTISKEVGCSIQKLPKSDILVICKEDGTTLIMNKTTGSAQSCQDIASAELGDASQPVVDIDNFKGFLLAKGNNVYVELGPTNYEKAGGQRLRELLSKDDFWNLVPREEQAHFIIKYRVSLYNREYPRGLVSV